MMLSKRAVIQRPVEQHFLAPHHQRQACCSRRAPKPNAALDMSLAQPVADNSMMMTSTYAGLGLGASSFVGERAALS